jgi:type I restriction enzyme M protein
MPSGVFKPYAGVSTAVVFFTKTGTGGTDKVWFYDMQADGYTLDDKRAENKDNDIQDIVNRYHNLKEEASRLRTDKSFLVPFSEIEANEWDLSINRYKEVVYDEVSYAQPSTIISEIKQLDIERSEALIILEGLLR